MWKKRTRVLRQLTLGLMVFMLVVSSHTVYVEAGIESMDGGGMLNTADAPIVEVDWNDTKQVIDGLGGAFAFNKAAGIKQIYDADPVTGRELLDLMFSHDNGIGLDIVRVIIGDGGITNPATGAEWGNRFYDGPSDTVWPNKADGFVWDQPDWDAKKASFDEAQIWIMQEAMSYGVNTFYANAWSPPYWMKTNNSVLGQNGAKLKPESYQDYADYLVQYALGYKREFGIPITHIGPANESEAAHASYSGFVITAAEYKDFIQNYLGPTLQDAIDKGEFAALSMDPPKIVAPEGTNLNASINLGRAMLEDPESSKYVDVFSTHLYGTSSFNNGPLSSTGTTGVYPDFLRNYKLWQTEYMTQNNGSSAASANTQVYANQTITDGVYWANLLTNMFTSDPGFNAYLWWWPAGNNGADGSDLIRLMTTGSPQGNGSTVTGKYRAFKRLYTFGNFSRFIKTGDIRIEATRIPVAGMNISAYKKPDNNEFSIVAVNSGKEDQILTFELNNFPADTAAVVGYRTTASENQKLMEPIEVSDGLFTATVPANSVITFVPKTDHNLPGLTSKRDIFSTFEAEDNDGASGDFATIPVGTGGALSGMGNGDYVKFANVNFADGSANGGIVRRHILSMNAILASINGGIIEMRIDDPETGRVVGTYMVPRNNDGDTYKSYTIQVDTGDNAANGYHDVYMVFRGNGNELFNIDRFEFGEQVLPSGSILTNGSFESAMGAWGRAYGDSGTTIDRTTNQNYSAPPTATNSTTAYAAVVTNRDEAENGLSQNITEKLVEGAAYRVNGFFMPSVQGATGRINLVALDTAGEVVYSTTIAERNDLDAMVWSQVDSIFTYEAPAADFATMKIVFTDSTTDTLYVEEVGLVPYVDKNELIDVLSVVLDQDEYSEEHWLSIVALREEAWATVTDIAATQDDVDTKVTQLNDLYNNEVPSPSVPASASITGPVTAAANQIVDFTFDINSGKQSFDTISMTIYYDSSKLKFATILDEDDVVLLDDNAIVAANSNFKVLGGAVKEDEGEVFLLLSATGEQITFDGEAFTLRGKVRTDAAVGIAEVSIGKLEVLLDGSSQLVDISNATPVFIQVTAADRTVLSTLIMQAESLLLMSEEGSEIGQYPIGTKMILQSAVEDAKTIVNDATASEEDVAQAVAALDASVHAFKDLIIVPDLSALNVSIATAQHVLDTSVEGTLAGQYPVGSKLPLQLAIEQAISVRNNPASTQDEIDAVVTALNAKLDGFLGQVIIRPDPVVDKTALDAAITAAQSRLSQAKEGTKIGQYSASAIADLSAAIAAANVAMSDPSATQGSIDAERNNLNAAVSSFLTLVITLIPGQTAVSVKDLSFLVKYFGTSSADSNWSEVEIADIFDSGEISIRELAAVARMIISNWFNQ